MIYGREYGEEKLNNYYLMCYKYLHGDAEVLAGTDLIIQDKPYDKEMLKNLRVVDKICYDDTLVDKEGNKHEVTVFIWWDNSNSQKKEIFEKFDDRYLVDWFKGLVVLKRDKENMERVKNNMYNKKSN